MSRVLNKYIIPSLFLLVLLMITTHHVCRAVNTPYPLTLAEKTAILAAHNNARASVVPAAKTMPDLVWDDDLAATAQNWVNSCNATSSSKYLIDHNPNRSNGFPFYVGENIYASTAQVTNMSNPVTSWDDEKQYYDLATNTCQAGQICGHYTQLVWANSLKVGCGRGFCDNVTYKYTIVCDYGPGGNYNNEKPYVAGTSSPTSSSKTDFSPGNSASFRSLHKLCFFALLLAVMVAMR